MKAEEGIGALLFLGEIEEQAGHLVAAFKYAERALRVAETKHDARAEVVREKVEEYDRALPRARLTLSPTAPAGTAVFQGAERIAMHDGSAELRLDPGTVELRVEAPGRQPASHPITLARGDRKDVVLDAGAPSGAPSGQTGGGPPWRSISLWSGGALMVLGAGAGAIAIGKKGKLDDKCADGKVCPTSAQGDYDTAKRWATVSTVGIAAGAVLIGAGLVLLTDGSTEEGQELAGALTVDLNAGPGTAAVSGRWTF